VNEECLKANYQAHQKFRMARMEATVNGVHYTYDGLFAYIAFNHFVFKETIPSRCT
jgi:hypothetical protein